MPQQQQFSGNPFLLGDSERGSYDYSGMTPDEAQTQRNISQRRQMAKLMMYQGQQQAGKKGGMVGNIYVKASPMEGLAGVGQVGLGGLADYFLNKESKKASDEAGQLRKDRIDEYLKDTADVPEVKPSNPAITNAIMGQSRTVPLFAPQELERLVPPGAENDKDTMELIGKLGKKTEEIPEAQGPVTPGTPGIIRSQGDIMRAGLKAFAYGDPRLDKLVGHVTDQRNQQEQNKLMREERISRDKQSDIYKNLLLDKVIKGQQVVAEVAAGASSQRTDLGKIKSINDLLVDMDPASPEAKSLIDLRTKLSTHTPAASQTMNIDQGGPLVQEIMKKAGDNVSKTLESAQVAQRSLQTIQKVEEAIRTGKVISGPGATPTIYLRQLGSVLGVTGKDSEEILRNTRVAIQGMAQLQIDSSKAAQGQGAISDYERKLFERASAGGDLTNGEIAELMVAIKKVAQFTISANTQNVQKIRNLPKGGDVVAPFFELPKDTGTQSSSPSAVSPNKLNQGWSLEMME